jgi:hypothetical protein
LQDANRYATTQLIVTKEINQYCKLDLTYGLMQKQQINKCAFYSEPAQQHNLNIFVIQNVPIQWNAQGFGNELK